MSSLIRSWGVSFDGFKTVLNVFNITWIEGWLLCAQLMTPTLLIDSQVYSFLVPEQTGRPVAQNFLNVSVFYHLTLHRLGHYCLPDEASYLWFRGVWAVLFRRLRPRLRNFPRFHLWWWVLPSAVGAGQPYKQNEELQELRCFLTNVLVSCSLSKFRSVVMGLML